MASRASCGALFERRQRFALKPLQRQQPAGRQGLFDPGHVHERPVGEHEAVELGDLRLPLVVELLAHPLADFMRDLPRVDRRADATMEREQEIELGEIGFDRGRHLGILQLAGQRLASQVLRFMHLA